MSVYKLNELNKDSKGGSEMMMFGLVERIQKVRPDLFDGIQLISSRVRDLEKDKYKIYWLHDLPQDPETVHLKDPASRARFDQLVFCGNWQFQQYRTILGVPFDERTAVIETAIEPFKQPSREDKNPETINLIYTSTPQRGLAILVPVFVELAKLYPQLRLHVFSSFEIYGWKDADKPFEPLFKTCREHPQIIYHGFQPNEKVREQLTKTHILAYPSIWEECNSRSLIEAMSAGCLCVHPNFGGLPDTAGGMTRMYPWHSNINNHANIFYLVLKQAIDGWINEFNEVYDVMTFVKTYADIRYNWDKIVDNWIGLLESVKYRPKVQPVSHPGVVPGNAIFTYSSSR